MNGYALLTAVLIIGAAVYAVDLWRRPLTRCRKCKGTGRVAGSTSKRWNYCKKCKDKPPRQRVGAQLVRPGLRRRK